MVKQKVSPDLHQPTFKDLVIQIILQIPEGRVTNYGAIASAAGVPRGGRLVGGVLHFNTESLNLPWHRIINRHGYISTNCLEHPKPLQKALLEQEGVEVGDDFMVDLSRYGWFPQASLDRR